ncbi:MAG: hypothetical protein ABIK44_07630 [candidate division WOR-3 bacterium]
MPCTVYLDTKTGKAFVVMEEVDRVEVDGPFFKFFAGDREVAVFNREKVFGYELSSATPGMG